MIEKIKAMNAIVKQVIVELRDHPLTLILIVSLMGWSFYAHYSHAEKLSLATHIAHDQQLFSSINSRLDMLLELSLADQLNSMQDLWCDPGNDRREIERTMQGLQVQYRQVAGSRYTLRPCRE